MSHLRAHIFNMSELCKEANLMIHRSIFTYYIWDSASNNMIQKVELSDMMVLVMKAEGDVEVNQKIELGIRWDSKIPTKTVWSMCFDY